MSLVKKVGGYQLGRTLGTGSFAKVREATFIITGEKFAIKIIDREVLQKEHLEEQMRREIAVMKLLQQRHIVRLVEVMRTSRNIYLVMELIQGGELFDRIVQSKRFDENTSRIYFQQLISGVEFCHANGIVHRDLKPENLLLTEKNELKISDFGFSNFFDDVQRTRRLLTTVCGTPHYAAPDVLQGNTNGGYNGMRADLWSCAVILYVMLAGAHPFSDPTQDGLFRKICAVDYRFPSGFPEGPKRIIQKVLIADPERRATLQQIKDDPWFAQDCPEYILAPVVAMGAIRAVSSLEPDMLSSAMQDLDRLSGSGDSFARGKGSGSSGRVQPRRRSTEILNGFDLLSSLTADLIVPLAGSLSAPDSQMEGSCSSAAMMGAKPSSIPSPKSLGLSSPSSSASSSDAHGGSSSGLGVMLRKSCAFLATGDAEDVYEIICEELTKHGSSVKKKSNEFRATIMNMAPSARAIYQMEVFDTVALGLSMVEFKRMHGDTLIFHDVYLNALSYLKRNCPAIFPSSSS